MTTGTKISATATVLFNNARAAEHRAADYTLDSVAPTTQLNVSQIGSSPNYQVTWNSTDDAGGSGVAYVTLYVSEDGGGYQIWQDQVTMASGTMIYQGQAGHTYTFLALATDVAGNHELPPAGTNAPQDTTTVNLGALPTVPSTTPPNFGIPPAPTVQPSTNPLFTQAQQGVPAAPPASNPSEFMTVLEPFQAQSFATGVRPERRHSRPDGAGPGARRQLPGQWRRVARTSCSTSRRMAGPAGNPLATLPYQIFALAFDSEGHLWAATGGGPLLQLDPSTGAIVNEFGEGVTLAVAVDPKTDQIYVATGSGVEIFDPTTTPSPSTAATRTCGSRASRSTPKATCGRSPGPMRGRSSSSTITPAPRSSSRSIPTSSRSPSASRERISKTCCSSRTTMPPNTPGGTVAPTPTELTMVDVTTLQQVAVAQGGTRGFDVLATSDGRLLISQSHEVDVLEPVVPPNVVAVNPPPNSIAALPLAFIDVTFDQDMFAGPPATFRR